MTVCIGPGGKKRSPKTPPEAFTAPIVKIEPETINELPSHVRRSLPAKDPELLNCMLVFTPEGMAVTVTFPVDPVTTVVLFPAMRYDVPFVNYSWLTFHSPVVVLDSYDVVQFRRRDFCDFAVCDGGHSVQ